jgi:hypothetical protein
VFYDFQFQSIENLVIKNLVKIILPLKLSKSNKKKIKKPKRAKKKARKNTDTHKTLRTIKATVESAEVTISSNEVMPQIGFAPWNVRVDDVEKFNLNKYDEYRKKRLGHPDFDAIEFVFSLPLANTRFGQLEFSCGNVDFISSKGICLTVESKHFSFFD